MAKREKSGKSKAGRFSFKEERWLLSMASKLTIESAAARLKRRALSVRKKAEKMGIFLKEARRKRAI